VSRFRNSPDPYITFGRISESQGHQQPIDFQCRFGFEARVYLDRAIPANLETTTPGRKEAVTIFA